MMTTVMMTMTMTRMMLNDDDDDDDDETLVIISHYNRCRPIFFYVSKIALELTDFSDLIGDVEDA